MGARPNAGSSPRTNRSTSPRVSSSSSKRAVDRVTAGGLTAQAVAELVGGRLLGDGAVTIRTVRPLDRAGPEALSFAISNRYAEELRASRAGAVLVPDALAEAEPGPRTRIVVRDPYAALTRVMGVLFPPAPAAPGVDPTVRIGPGSVLGAGVRLGPFVVLGRSVRLGDRCQVAEGVSL